MFSSAMDSALAFSPSFSIRCIQICRRIKMAGILVPQLKGGSETVPSAGYLKATLVMQDLAHQSGARKGDYRRTLPPVELHFYVPLELRQARSL